MEWSWNYTESLNKRRVVIGKNKHQIIPSGWRAMRFWFSSGQANFSSFSGMFYLKIPSYLLPLSAFGSFPSWTSQIIIYFRCSITKESDCFEEEVHNRQKHQYSSSMGGLNKTALKPRFQISQNFEPWKFTNHAFGAWFWTFRRSYSHAQTQFCHAYILTLKDLWCGLSKK